MLQAYKWTPDTHPQTQFCQNTNGECKSPPTLSDAGRANSRRAQKAKAAPVVIIWATEKKPVTLNIYFLPLVTGSHFDLPVRGVVTTKAKQKCYWEKEKPEGLLSLLLSKLNWDSVILKVNTYLQWETFCYGSSGPSKKYLLSIEMSTQAPNLYIYFF